MLIFIILAVLLVALSVWVLIRPILRAKASDSFARHEQNIHFARERLQEIEDQKRRGVLAENEYEALKIEIETTLAQDIDLAANSEQSDQSSANNPNDNINASSNAVVITLVCCLIPVLSAATYFVTGTPSAVNKTAPAQIAQAAQGDTQQIDELIRSLEARLREQPNDTQGWLMLARTHQQMGQFEQSIAAYKQLAQLQPQNPDVYAGLADASAFLNGGSLAGEPSKHIQRTLELAPNHPQGLWLAGLAQAQIGLTEDALSYWQRLLPLLDGFPEQQAQLRDVMQQATASGDNSTQTAKLSSERPISTRNDVPAQNGPALNVSVALAKEVAVNVSPSDTVFIIARAKQGPPAPLAVKRLRVSDLPAQIILTDQDSMISQLSLSKFSDVNVIARISLGGNPIAQTGDYESATVSTSNDEPEQISLVIEKIVP